MAKNLNGKLYGVDINGRESAGQQNDAAAIVKISSTRTGDGIIKYPATEVRIYAPTKDKMTPAQAKALTACVKRDVIDVLYRSAQGVDTAYISVIEDKNDAGEYIEVIIRDSKKGYTPRTINGIESAINDFIKRHAGKAAPAPAPAPADGNGTPAPAPAGGSGTPTPAPAGNGTPAPAPAGGNNGTPAPAPADGNGTPAPAPAGNGNGTPAPAPAGGNNGTPAPAPAGNGNGAPAPAPADGNGTPAPTPAPAPAGDSNDPANHWSNQPGWEKYIEDAFK